MPEAERKLIHVKVHILRAEKLRQQADKHLDAENVAMALRIYHKMMIGTEWINDRMDGSLPLCFANMTGEEADYWDIAPRGLLEQLYDLRLSTRLAIAAWHLMKAKYRRCVATSTEAMSEFLEKGVPIDGTDFEFGTTLRNLVSTAFLRRGLAYDRLNKSDDALLDLKEAALLRPDKASISIEYGRAQAKKEQPDFPYAAENPAEGEPTTAQLYFFFWADDMMALGTASWKYTQIVQYTLDWLAVDRTALRKQREHQFVGQDTR